MSPSGGTDATPGARVPPGAPGVARKFPRAATEAERFWRHAMPDASGCWLWTSVLGQKGYPRFRSGVTKQYVAAHRWAYEHLVGPIPDGMELDHLCRVRRCVRPEHLEPVTHAENCRRAAAHPESNFGQGRRKKPLPSAA